MALNYLPFEPSPVTVRRRGGRGQRAALGLAVCWFLAGGAAHFLFTEALVRVVPPAVPDPRDVVLLTGLLWLLGALGLMMPWTRRTAGWGLVLLTIAVTPVHVYMLHAHDQFPSLPTWLLWARLPLQLVVLWLAWWGSRWRKPPRGLLY